MSSVDKQAAARAEIEQKLTAICCQVLNREQVSASSGFFELGMDSLSAVAVADIIAQEFGCPFEAIQLLQYPTVALLTQYILDNRPAEADAHLAPSLSVAASEPAEASTRAGAPEGVPSYYEDSVAIIGVSCRFPGARDHREFWQNLLQGRASIEVLSVDELRRMGVAERLIADPDFVPVRTTLVDKDQFDAEFFRIAAREAEAMDPQLRLLLQHAWGAVEDAGYVPEDIPDTSVFVSTANHLFGGPAEAHSQTFTLEHFSDHQRWLLAQSGSAPTAISYRLGLKGPSYSVHSNCSSSLVGLKLASQALLQGDSRYALVGAASVSSMDGAGYRYHQGLPLSSDGRVKAFDAAADGMVVGEGVAMLLLKRAKDAIADGDHIYSIVRSVALNNDGAAKAGFYAPSVQGQAEVIEKALDAAGVHPESISFVECHGTGTAMGDPIEIAALTQTYRRYTEKKQFCGIGSVKSNIGHMDTAAGLAGVIKASLALEAGEVPPTINVEQVNEKLNLTDSPFFVLRHAHKLDPTLGPHRAAVSAFGIGGTNTHALLEQVSARAPAPRGELGDAKPYLVPLSARSEPRLRHYAASLLAFLEAHGPTPGDAVEGVFLANLAYTLQVGRHAMAVRLGLLVRSREELQSGLREFLDGAPPSRLWRHGAVKSPEGTGPRIVDEDDRALLVESWLAKGKYERVLETWVGGQSFDWNRLYGATKPQRISLPTYSFEPKRVPLLARSTAESVGAHQASAQLHPLLHRNSSDLTSVRFSSRFHGSEAFLADHRVGGERMLPGSAHLEMARAAVEQVAGAHRDQTVRLEEVVWARPLTVGDEAVDVHVALRADGEHAVRYEIFAQGADAKRVVYSRGRAVLGAPRVESRIDLELELQRPGRTELSVHDCYARFKAAGIDYGPSHRVIEAAHLWEDQVIARLTLGAQYTPINDAYFLHPAIVDGALQAVGGLIAGADGSTTLSVPFSLDTLEANHRCTQSMWVIVRRQRVHGAEDRRARFDIQIVDDEGLVCVVIHGFSTRALDRAVSGVAPASAPALAEISPQDLVGYLLLKPVWERITIASDSRWPREHEKVVLLGDPTHLEGFDDVLPDVRHLPLDRDAGVDEIAQALRQAEPFDHILWLVPHGAKLTLATGQLFEAQRSGTLFGFRLVKALLGAGFGSKALGLTIVTPQTQRVLADDEIQPAHAGVLGFAGSMAKEQRAWKVRAVDAPAGAALPWRELIRLPPHPGGEPYAYRNGDWYKQQMLACSLSGGELAPQSALYKKNGVYVVVGGAGGLGMLWSEMMVRDYQAHVIWIGRREKGAVIESEISRLARLGPAPLYIRADASEPAELLAAYTEIKRHHARIDGVVQAAVELRDKTLATMDEESFSASLRAKVSASIAVAQTFAPEPLDFLLLFSSILSFVKSPGQSNYAAGCVFQDALGQWLSDLLPGRVRVMNWGYWGSIGRVATEAYRERMAKAGIDSIEPEVGLAALSALLDGPTEQLAFLRTNRPPQDGWVRTDERLTILSTRRPSVVSQLPSEVAEPAAALHSCTGPAHLDILVGRILKSQLEQVGALSTTRMPVSEGMRLLPRQYGRWYEESLRFLAERGEIELAQGTCRSLPSRCEPSELWRAWEEQRASSHDDVSLRAQVALVDATLRALPDILRGKTPATSVMFPSSSMSLMEGVYKNNPTADYFNDALADLVEASVTRFIEAHPSATLRILEVGAGTGGTSARVFPKLRAHRGQIGEYCYTDLSRAFLMHAQKAYGHDAPYLRCQILDIEKSLISQGIELGGYDILIATNVLHATRNVRATLRNVKAALRPRGLLMLNEMSVNSLFMHLTFGLLDGWWLYDDPALRLPGCPLLSPASWGRVLQQEGFERVSFPTARAEKLGQQVIVAESDGVVRHVVASAKLGSQETRPSASAASSRRALEPSRGGSPEMRVRAQLRACLASALQIKEGEIDDRQAFGEYGVDSIIAVDLIRTINEKLGTTLQTVTLFDHDSVDKLTQHLVAEYPAHAGASVEEGRQPEAADPQGHGARFERVRKIVRQALAKAVGAAESTLRDDVSFAELGVDSIIAVDLIGDINARLGVTLQTMALFEHGDVQSLTQHVLGGIGAGQARPAKLSEPSAVAVSVSAPAPRERAAQAWAPLPLSPTRGGRGYHRVLIERPGDVADLRIVESPMAALKPHEVRIGVRAFALNFGDLLCVRGLYPTMPPYPFTPGAEVSGVVVEVGPAVEHVRPGDDVVAVLGQEFGGHATMVTCSAVQLMPKPANLTFEEACSLPVTAMTMIECFRRAQLQPGESILIQTATSGTGLVALQLAKACGAEVYATAGSNAKLDYLRALGVERCINYVEADFEEELRRMTRGRGVDVIINTLGADAMQKGLRSLSPGGRYVEIAMTALRSAKRIDLSVLNDNQTFYSVDMRRLLLADPKRAQQCRQDLIERLEAGLIRPTVSRVFDMQEVRDAYELLARRSNIGKVVVRVPESAQLHPVDPALTPPARVEVEAPGAMPNASAGAALPRPIRPATERPIEAGLRALTVPGPRQLSVALFYPSWSQARAIPLGGFTARVATNGVPAERAKGLIVVSHGYAGGELVHDNLATHLARAGYIVACLKHAGDNWFDRSLFSTAEYFLERPRQVSRVLDAVLSDPEWRHRIPQDGVGALGHSMGGYTVLALLGAQVDPDKVVEYCRNPPNVDTQALIGTLDEAQLRAVGGVLKAVDARSLLDERIRAAVVMAPCWSVFEHRSIGRIDRPLRIYLAEHDTVIDRTCEGASLAQLAHRAHVQEVRGAGHFSFTAPRERSAMPLGNSELARLIMVDPPDFDRAAFHRVLEQEVASFFDAHLTARAEAPAR